MSSSSFRKPEELFAVAIALAPDEREKYLDDVCSTDTVLRSELQVLINSHDRAGDFLESPAISPTTVGPLMASDDDAPLPSTIAHFKIVGLLGSGGMGRVYLAESANLRRQVALKVIKPGMASRSTLRRFEQEAQVVALLQHPGIAQIYEAGTADTGAGPQPYFAMEYVKGAALNEFIKKHALDVRAKLELFCRICDAVSHAHQKNVIHRDLKPANILVDETSQPKILDFGVARLTDPGTAATNTLYTHAGQLIGTLAYMSPEQVAGDPNAIDSRSDVYTLGVILYETLTGKLPHDVSHRPLPEAIRIIREDSPTSLSTTHREYRGDIETIVSKALEKDKDRRYQTAAEVADDVRRSLRDEPIVARPPSTWYQIAKFAKRNKAVVGGTLAAFMALSLGLVATVTQAQLAEIAKDDAELQARIATEANVEAKRQREQAEASAIEANKSREEALKQKESAEKSLEVAAGVRRFLEQIISSADPDEHMGRDVTVLQALERSEANLDETMPTQPHVRAAIHMTIGGMYRTLAEYRQAEPHLRMAVKLYEEVYGPEHDQTLAATVHLCLLLDEFGKSAEAIPRCEAMWELVQDSQVVDPERRVSIASALAGLYGSEEQFDDSMRLREYVIQERERNLPDDDESVLNARYMKARVLSKTGRFAESVPLGREVVEAHKRSGRSVSRVSVTWLVGLCGDLIETGRLDEATPYVEQVVADAAKIYSPDHAGYLSAINIKGLYLLRRGEHKAAEEVFREVVAAHRRIDLPAVDGLCRSLSNLGASLERQKKWPEAEAVYKEALDIVDGVPGKPMLVRLGLLSNLATVVRLQSRFDEAFDLYKQLIETGRQVLPPNHWQLAVHMYGYAIVLGSRGKLEESERQLLDAYKIATAILPEKPEMAVTINRSLVDLYEKWDKVELAEEWRAKLPAELRKKK